MKRGDVVIRFDGQEITSVQQFRNLVGLTKTDKKVAVVAIRNGKNEEFKVMVGSLKDEEIKVAAESDTLTRLGMNVQNLTADLARQFGYDKQEGVLITEVEMGTPAQAAGIRPGMLILEVNRSPVKSTKDLIKAIDNSKKSKKILFLLSDTKYTRYVMLDIE
jgi:serine protease Do